MNYNSCQQEYKPEIGLQYSCPDYKSPMEDIRSGRELKIAPIEYSAINHQLSTIQQLTKIIHQTLAIALQLQFFP